MNLHEHLVCVPPELHRKEIEYYRRELEIARRIIEQLVDPKPWNIIFIHPADLCEIINRMSPKDLIISEEGIFGPRTEGAFGQQFNFQGRTYVQTTLIPAKTQNYR